MLPWKLLDGLPFSVTVTVIILAVLDMELAVETVRDSHGSWSRDIFDIRDSVVALVVSVH